MLNHENAARGSVGANAAVRLAAPPARTPAILVATVIRRRCREP
jgi:hypothetical protein